MRLTANSMTFEHKGEDGYSFTADAVHDPEFGWAASVSMNSNGARTPEDAIQHLRHSAEAFLWALKEMEGT